MDSPHFGISSGSKGSAVEFLSYITRQGRHAHRGDLVATGYGNMERSNNIPSVMVFSLTQIMHAANRHRKYLQFQCKRLGYQLR